MIQTCRNKIVTTTRQHMAVTISLCHDCVSLVSPEQPCNKSHQACYKYLTTYSNNLEQAVRTQLVNSLWTELLQDVYNFCNLWYPIMCLIVLV